MLRSRRIAYAAAAIVLGLSACGDAGSTTSAGKPPAVIHIGASSGEKVAAPTAGGAQSDSMMRVMGNITYVYDGTYPDLGSTGPAFQLSAGNTVDAATVAKLAALLGVQGDVRTLPADQGGGWQVGPADYSGANLTVAADGLLSWWFNPAPGDAVSAGGCVSEGKPAPDIAVDTAGGGTDAILPPDTAVVPPDAGVDPNVDPTVAPCDIAPPAPANVPTKDEATTRAKQLLADMGLDASKYEFTSYADAYGASVTAWLMLAGHRSPIQINVGYGAEGALTWASGALAVPQQVADYPIVSGADALARLNDPNGQWNYFGGPMAKGGVGIAGAATDVAVSTGSAVNSGGAPNAGSGGATVDPSVAAPEPAPVCDPAADCTIEAPPVEPITVHLSSMRMDLTMVWDADGSIWLLPAYTFTSADGGEYTVVAVDDSLLDLPDPAPVDTTPVDTTPVPVPVDTAPVPGTVPVDTVVSPPIDTVPPATTAGDTVVTVDQAAATTLLVGLSLDEATKVATDQGWELRVSTLDGEGQALTDDLRSNRVDIAVSNNVVTGIDFVG
jgi:hypothetical protein